MSITLIQGPTKMGIENTTRFHTMACSCGINEMTLPPRPYDEKILKNKEAMKEYVTVEIFKPLLKFIREVRDIHDGMFGCILFSDGDRPGSNGEFWAKELAKYGEVITSKQIHNPSYQSTGTKIKLYQWYLNDETKAYIETLGPNKAPVEHGWYPHTNIFYTELTKKAKKLDGKVGVAK